MTVSAVVRTGLGSRAIALAEREERSAAPGEVVLDVELCGLCGSDAHIWRGDDGYEWVRTGRILGHEVVGRIRALGADVSSDWSVGDRVVPIAQVGCGTCAACRADYANGCDEKLTLGLSRDGGASARVNVRADSLVRVPGDLPALTAVLTEPASVAARAVARARIGSGDRLVVSGPGAVGILSALVARDAGAEVVLVGTESDVATRGDLLRALGFEVATAVPVGFTPDVWIEAAGAEGALRAAAQALPVAGRLVLVALYGTPPDPQLNVLVRKELDVITSYSSFRPDYERALNTLLRHPEVGATLVRPYALEDLERAFDAIGSGGDVKVALRP